MKGSRRLHRVARLLLLGALLAVPALALAQTGGGYNLSWHTVDGGGATFSTGGGYTLGGTIGQAEAGALSGGGYVLSGGFWAGGGAVSIEYRIYLPLVLRND